MLSEEAENAMAIVQAGGLVALNHAREGSARLVQNAEIALDNISRHDGFTQPLDDERARGGQHFDEGKADVRVDVASTDVPTYETSTPWWAWVVLAFAVLCGIAGVSIFVCCICFPPRFRTHR